MKNNIIEMENEMKRWQEKTAIVFWLMKRKKSRTPVTYETFVSLYKSIWREDFQKYKNEDNSYCYDEISKVMTPIYDYGFERYNSLSASEMRRERASFLHKEAIPAQIFGIAQTRNLTIRKNKNAVMGVTLGGFQIRNKKNNRVLAGNKFELSYFDVCKYLGVNEEKAKLYLKLYLEDCEKGKGNTRKSNNKNKSKNKNNSKNKNKNKRKDKNSAEKQ